MRDHHQGYRIGVRLVQDVLDGPVPLDTRLYGAPRRIYDKTASPPTGRLFVSYAFCLVTVRAGR